MKILFLTHRAKQCGVKAHGQRFIDAMVEHSPVNDQWIVNEVGSMDEIRESIKYWKPNITIINFHPNTMNYFEPELNFSLNTKLVALPHENLTVSGAFTFLIKYSMFEAVLWQDPTLRQSFENVYKIPRCIPRFFRTKRPDRRDIPKENIVIKSFGFSHGGKMPEKIISAIEESFDCATLVGHFPSNELVDPDGVSGEMMIEKLKSAVTEPGIQILRSKEMYCGQYMSENDLIQWLADADINICMHEEGTGGLSSTTDLMMAAGVPFAVNQSPFFRHLPEQIKLKSGNTMMDIFNAGTTPWKHLADENWSPKVFAYEVNRALRTIFSKVK